ncbi:MAG: CHAT domain-containing protein [Phycisphaerales bacterium]|nr:CHAT domain-containing protein [Hyphomonadaceae bacterium]
MRLMFALLAAAALAACERPATEPAAPATRQAEFSQPVLRAAAPAPASPRVCVEDGRAALVERLRVDGLWVNDAVAGPMSPRMAGARIAAHDEASLLAGLLRYGPGMAVLVTYAGEDESCAWLLSRDGLVAYGRNGVSVGQVALDVAAVMSALDVEGARAARTPVLRSETQTVPPQPLGALREGELATALAHVAESVTPGPIAAELGRYESLIVVPHQALAGFPMMLLTQGRAEGRPNYLVDRMSIQVAPALSEIGIGPGLHRDLSVELAAMTAEQRRAVLSEALIVGDPRFNDAEYLMPQLEGAALEARNIAATFGASPLLGADATNAAVRGRLRERPRYVHFATHGLADFHNATGNRSFVALADGGRLTLADVRAERMANGAIVVLSACQTGLGASRPGGFVGLPRAFQNAGAQTVVMSLWNVDDAATNHMMQGFARKLAETGRPASSFAAAVRETRARYPDPRLWASFEVFSVAQP